MQKRPPKLSQKSFYITNASSKVAGHKINMQKSVGFVYQQ
jgi:hypothetical protein